MIVLDIFVCLDLLSFFFKQKTAYEVRISDWSSDVCSSDLEQGLESAREAIAAQQRARGARHVEPERIFIGNGVSELIDLSLRAQIGRASCRERVCQYV